MEARAYKTRAGLTQYKPVVQADDFRTLADDMTGFCLACGEEVEGMEQDARREPCEHCKAPKVYGLEQLLVMGLCVIDH